MKNHNNIEPPPIARSKPAVYVFLLVLLITISAGIAHYSRPKIAPSVVVIDDSPLYTDGMYRSQETYTSPEGNQVIGLRLTVMNGSITEASVQQVSSQGKYAGQYQADFIKVYKESVVGKELSTLHLDRVAGASLTTQAFNNAVASIANQARKQ
ncbi:hypothetical protein BH09PAT3_BH09PAT3_6090 [soil metagenome]